MLGSNMSALQGFAGSDALYKFQSESKDSD